MTQLYTRQAIQAFQSDLDLKSDVDQKDWYKKDTYYQILLVERNKPDEEKEGQNLRTRIVAKKRGTGEKEKPETDSFDDFELDSKTIEKLEAYPRKGNKNKLSSYLPSPGVVLKDAFIDELYNEGEHDKNKQTEINNFYVTTRPLLYSRKISQLIAKTWWSYLQAQKNAGQLWENFTKGEWDEIDSYILDGLIAREIFLYAGGNSPNHIDSEEVYLPLKLKEETKTEARFMILPTSRAWQGISLSLLLSGQAYYEIRGEYHQISQPILSTGEITSKYSVEVDWNKFNGHIKEFVMSHEKPWIAYEAVLPYPPIPYEATAAQENLKKWADAKEDEKPLPFYIKSKDDKNKYFIDVDYFRPPYPYIPLSCT